MRYRISYIETVKLARRIPLSVTYALGACAAVLVIGFAGYLHAPAHAFSSGTGTWDDPYTITSCTDLESIGNSYGSLNADYVLANNIDCSGIPNFTPIGGNGASSAFTGRFDGAGHSISNLAINKAGNENIALFGSAVGAFITDVNIVNATVDGQDNVGAVVGLGTDVALVGVAVSGSSVTAHSPHGAPNHATGGIAGDIDTSYLYDVSAQSTTVSVDTGDTSLNHPVGGIVGVLIASPLANAFSSATVTNQGPAAGGIVGESGNTALENVYYTGAVTATSNVGGIVGSDQISGPTTISRAYFSGVASSTSSDDAVGGIVGIATPATVVDDSFSVGAIKSSGINPAGAIIGADSGSVSTLSDDVYSATLTGATCDGSYDDSNFTSGECKVDNTTTDYYSPPNAPLSAWDFNDVWETQGGTFPTLRVLPYVAPPSAVAVSSCSDLAAHLFANPNGWYSLSGDIDCSSNPAVPFSTTTAEYFTGRIDGNGHTISGVSSISKDTPSESPSIPIYAASVGLFGDAYGAIFDDFSLSGTGVTGTGDGSFGAGALVGAGESHMVVDTVHSSVPVSGIQDTGGLVGIGESEFHDVSVAANVTSTGSAYLGGLIGYHGSNAVITGSSYSGTLADGDTAGGLAGYIGSGFIDSSSVSGHLSGNIDLGGLVGYLDFADGTSTVSNSTSHMDMSLEDLPAGDASGNVGGIVGEGFDTDYTGDLFDGTISLDNSDDNESISGIGGLVGDASSDGEYAFTDSTSTGSITLVGSGNAPSVHMVGGIGGDVEGYDILDDYASSPIIVGSGLVPSSNVQYIGGLAGDFVGDTTIATSSASGSITITGDQSATEVVQIGGIAGDAQNSSAMGTASDVSSTVNISAVGEDIFTIGGLFGQESSFTVSSSSAVSTISLTGPSTLLVGGLIGESDNSTLSKILSTGTVSITAGQDGTSPVQYLGGLIGDDNESVILNAYSNEAMTVNSAVASGDTGDWLGGLLGSDDAGSDVERTYATGSLTLSDSGSPTWSDVGGLVGRSGDSGNTIKDSFASLAPSVSGTRSDVGAFLGLYDGGETLADDAYDSSLAGSNLCTGTDGTDPGWCSAHTPTSYFYDQTNAPMSNWDFTNVWGAHVSTYPTFIPGSGGGGGGGTTVPTVVTDAATSITDTTATLNGTVSATGGANASVRGFVYGTTISYGATTTESGSFSTGAFSAGLSSLACETTYHVAAYATNTSGTGYGSDQTFTTDTCSGGGGSGDGGSSGSSGSTIVSTVPTAPIAPTSPVATATPVRPPPGQPHPTPSVARAGSSMRSTPPPAGTGRTSSGGRASPLGSATTNPLAMLYLVFTGNLGTTTEKVIAVAGILVSFIGICWAYVSTFKTLTDIGPMFMRGLSTFFSFGFLRRRLETWGTVYDSVTRWPLDPAVVTLFDAQGKQVKQSITDLDGRFGFFVPAGTYTLKAEKGYHSFPAKKLPAVDPVYQNRYQGGPIEVAQDGVLIKDVPLDPIGFDWNEYEKYRRGLYRFFSRFDRPLAYLSLWLTIFGAVAAIISVFVDPALLGILLVILYAIIGAAYLLGFGPRIYGSVHESDGEALPFALIRARRPGGVDPGAHTVADHLGRYYLLLPPGNTFVVSVEALRGPNVYVELWSGLMKTQNGYLNRTIALPR